jgi:D-alanyl-D-alanine carboxypeptidase/D-alanyl-D-alanine-endopeptidase (penicillin-binding protein 4)
MRILYITLCLMLTTACAHAQTLGTRLANKTKQLLADEQMKHALLGLYVADAATGSQVFSWNGSIGLAPASTQKVVTSTAALELLGPSFRYATLLARDGDVVNGRLQGNLVVVGAGDPSLGSWRYAGTKREEVLARIGRVLQQQGIRGITGGILVLDTAFSYQPLPGGWIWDDIGNYYGAGTWALNWNENQYDLQLKPGSQAGTPTQVMATHPAVQGLTLRNLIQTGRAGSGDHGYIYLSPYAQTGFTQGTVPAGVNSFTISGSLPNPAAQFGAELRAYLQTQGIEMAGPVQSAYDLLQTQQRIPAYQAVLDTIYSPPLDSLVYWFLQKSINLYGEALAKTLAVKAGQTGSTEAGTALLRQFWSQRGIEPSALHILDGSGLSPQNRVTTEALTAVLLYARKQSWFGSFYQALPLYNNMKMKSGTIGGSKAFTGYQAGRDGKTYVFAMIINNFDGPASAIVQKMYKVLDELKQ